MFYIYNVWLQTFELRTSNFSVEFVFDQLVIKVNVKQLELKVRKLVILAKLLVLCHSYTFLE